MGCRRNRGAGLSFPVGSCLPWPSERPLKGTQVSQRKAGVMSVRLRAVAQCALP
ncbi:hypothetical protein CSUI_006621 [Cystoisospora suis]|uniref:Uncharacterized protein n=1 Tax=Cystoisospora suis TaxID=483139 RepID=A0A2C6KGE2_9APIC|nr:hypothetical protein CSUI_006621 [Cystoisospora suis]